METLYLLSQNEVKRAIENEMHRKRFYPHRLEPYGANEYLMLGGSLEHPYLVEQLIHTINELLEDRPCKNGWVPFWSIAGLGNIDANLLEDTIATHSSTFKTRKRGKCYDVRVLRKKKGVNL